MGRVEEKEMCSAIQKRRTEAIWMETDDKMNAKNKNGRKRGGRSGGKAGTERRNEPGNANMVCVSLLGSHNFVEGEMTTDDV